MAKWKLVRDFIPAYIHGKTGIDPECATLKDWELPFFLDRKLVEEEGEYKEAAREGDVTKIREELVDIIEVMRARAEYHGIAWSSVLAHLSEKRRKRGGFFGRVIAKL